MDLVTGAIGAIAPKLMQLLKEEYSLHKGLRKKVKFLSEELESIHAALRKVAEVPPDQIDEQVRIWARQVREASYNMEDILDTFLVHAEDRACSPDHGKLKRAMKKIGNLFTKGKAFHDIADAIDDVKKQLQELSERRARYRVDEIMAKAVATTSTIDCRLEAMYKEVTQLIGLEKSISDLVAMMMLSSGDAMSNNSMKIISVVGAGGLGKTSLAKAVYDKLKVQFSCGAFIPVGRNPNLKIVFRNILIDLDKETYMDLKFCKLDERQLINELLDFLRTRRYLIVIDDLWETKSWEIIQLALVENNNGSRIITTTRKTQVATGEVYNLQPLSYDCSKKLFNTRIFGGEGKCPDSQLDEISEKILKKCDGVPLAIITMASLLVGKSRDEWHEVDSSIGFSHKDNEQVDNTMKIIALSYYDLPSHLRTCLLYLSAFPEDYFIEKGSLIWKWVAEGFVSRKTGIGLFELAEGYLHDLINRSMIQIVELDYGYINGVWSSNMIQAVEFGTLDIQLEEFPTYGYRVHDMVLDLMRSLSREENFVTISDNEKGKLSGSHARRFSLQDTTMAYPHKDTNHKDKTQVRSIIACRCDIFKCVPLVRFKLLRVLALEYCRHKEEEGRYHLEHLGELLHLRYLGLRHTPIFELPNEIGRLKFLQTLDLEGTGIEELPSSVGLLTQLVCLCARDTRMPNGITGRLTSLEELQIKPVDVDKTRDPFVKELGSVSEIRVLRITNNEPDVNESMQSDLLQSLSNLHKMQILVLGGWFITPELQSDKDAWDAAVLPRRLRHLILPSMWFDSLPSCINASNLPCLSHLFLNVYHMDEEGLRILGGLPQLRCFYLITLSTVTLTNVVADRCFQNLRSCFFHNSTVQFVVNEDASVSLSIWSGRDSVAFASKKDRCRIIAAPAVLPNLEVLQFKVLVQGLLPNSGSCGNLGLEHITSLRKIKVDFWCDGAFADDVDEQEAALRHAIEVHPNRPTLQVDFTFRDRMKSRSGNDNDSDKQENQVLTKG